ncbi:MAG TPA: biosynthetic arginine decarboxylase [Pyrinomonadaceae bacterium]|nr:biosynthetic arginine decarboxylase [Pyrinomonadaceae bacterium]
MTTAIEQTLETYGIENWGAGYFGINRKGNLIVHPSDTDTKTSADLKEIIDDLERRGISTPVLLRFPQLVTAQVRKLQRAFRAAIREFEYQGAHMCVYPMKVNQQRAVVEEYLREGTRYDFGLEAGSKAELYAAIALEQASESLLVLNGFKDEEFIELAFVGARAGKRVVIVIEKMSELDHILRFADIFEEGHEGDLPIVGLRVKLYSKGSGRWEKSGGEAAKFGLTTTEILEVIRRLQEAGRIEMLRLLHFHIGSQLTDIKRIKNAMKEAARVYAKIYQMKIPIELLDVGGGMAVDYDGSKTAFDSSANYNAQEFANDVIYTIKQVCDDENVPHPTVIQESGRYLSAYHAILVTNVQEEIETVVEDITPIEIEANDPQVVTELGDLRQNISIKNYREYYHDALEHRDTMFTLFNLGLISLEDRAKGEVLFWDVCERADKYAQQAEYVSEEFDELRRLSRAKYLTNFSVFRSAPDHWALDQLFPIVPIHRLNKIPTAYATLCDITCDSDGVVDKFVDLHDVKQVLELHPLIEGEPYYLAFLLVGAYQEVMGNNHNLFGTPNEAHIHIDEDGYLIKKVLRGMTVGEAVETARYEPGQLHDGFRRQVRQRIKQGELTEAEGAELVEFYESRAGAYTYLAVNGKERKK